MRRLCALILHVSKLLNFFIPGFNYLCAVLVSVNWNHFYFLYAEGLEMAILEFEFRFGVLFVSLLKTVAN